MTVNLRRAAEATPHRGTAHRLHPVFQRTVEMSQRLEQAYQPVGNLVDGEFPELNDVLHAVYEARDLL